MVVNRPGVRRDLLAMRPVADVVRRRAGRRGGEGLPLDPVAAVGEFAGHVTQRRDMYFAAQIVRHLRELETFSLKVPVTVLSLNLPIFVSGGFGTAGVTTAGIAPINF